MTPRRAHQRPSSQASTAEPVANRPLAIGGAQQSPEPGATAAPAKSETLPEDPFVHYDPQAVVAGLRALQGAFVGIDRARLLHDLREQQEQGSVGRRTSLTSSANDPGGATIESPRTSYRIGLQAGCVVRCRT